MNKKTHGTQLKRYAAFTKDPNGGNPAGVYIGEHLPPKEKMQSIAKELGYSETAFIAPLTGTKRQIRYFSPEAEVPFCGHATIASGVALGEISGRGVYKLETRVGEVPVSVGFKDDYWTASLTSVDTKTQPVPQDLLIRALGDLGWQEDDLDPEIPPANAYAGNWHLVLAVKSKSTLDRLNYDFESLKKLMTEYDLTTLQLIWKESNEIIHSRNPFPVGGVVEDPATGAAAAALGGYLREAGLLKIPNLVTIRQGEVMGRPSLITIEIPTSGGIIVSGTAVTL